MRSKEGAEEEDGRLEEVVERILIEEVVREGSGSGRVAKKGRRVVSIILRLHMVCLSLPSLEGFSGSAMEWVRESRKESEETGLGTNSPLKPPRKRGGCFLTDGTDLLSVALTRLLEMRMSTQGRAVRRDVGASVGALR